MSTFNDETPVTILVRIDAGALRALRDNQMTLSEPSDGAYFHKAVLRGIQALGASLVVEPAHADVVFDVIAHERSYVHTVMFTEDGFSVTHPLQERMTDMSLCGLHMHIMNYDEMPVDKPGTYSAEDIGDDAWHFTYLGPLPEETTT